jgi:hypothetical protein
MKKITSRDNLSEAPRADRPAVAEPLAYLGGKANGDVVAQDLTVTSRSSIWACCNSFARFGRSGKAASRKV